MSNPPIPPRIAVIDGLRGVAVLGIVVINVTGFWGPRLASLSPMLPVPGDPAARVWFAVALVLFDGKFRALFTMLFGASMGLMLDAAAARGRDGVAWQWRRLLWLALFGYAHYLLLWWGDILFTYALWGLVLVHLRRLEPMALLALALPVYVLAHGFACLGDALAVASEARVSAGHGSAADLAAAAALAADNGASMAADTRVLHAGWWAAVAIKLTTAPWFPFTAAFDNWAETLPLMALGLAAQRSGLFAGRWSPRVLTALAVGGIGLGIAATLALVEPLARAGWPTAWTLAVVTDFTALPRLVIAVGYAALVVRLWPWLGISAPARALSAAGRTALSNYLGTSVVMSALFCGWGLDWGLHLPRSLLPLVAAGAIVAMLAWPRWWLARRAQGPLEALWRRLARAA